MTLSEIVQALDAQEFEVKLAAVEQAYQGDDTRSQLFFEATELVKEAEAKGEFGGPLNDSQFLSLCTQVVEDQVAEMAKTASDESGSAEAGEEAGEELTKEAQEELYAYGQLAAEVLAENGITAEDLEKVASEEEAEALGRAAARLVAAKLDASEEE
jgi:hypothetical protein